MVEKMQMIDSKEKKNHLLNRNIFKFIVISMKYMTKIAKKKNYMRLQSCCP